MVVIVIQSRKLHGKLLHNFTGSDCGIIMVIMTCDAGDWETTALTTLCRRFQVACERNVIKHMTYDSSKQFDSKT